MKSNEYLLAYRSVPGQTKGNVYRRGGKSTIQGPGCERGSIGSRARLYVFSVLCGYQGMYRYASGIFSNIVAVSREYIYWKYREIDHDHESTSSSQEHEQND